MRHVYKKEAMDFLGSNRSYIKPLQPLWFYESLKKLYGQLYGKKIHTLVLPPEELIPYASENWLHEMTRLGVPLRYETILRTKRAFLPGPLEIEFKMDGYELTWNFGPYKSGRYTILRSGRKGIYYYKSPVPWKGSYSFGACDSPVYFKVAYHKDGQEVVSPEFELHIPSRKTLVYKSAKIRGQKMLRRSHPSSP